MGVGRVMGVGVVIVWPTNLCVFVKVVCGQGGAFQVQSVYVCECVRGGGGNTSPPLGGKGKRPAAI